MKVNLAKLFLCGVGRHNWTIGLRVHQKPNGDIYRVVAIRKCLRCDRGAETYHMGRWSGTTVLLGAHTVEDACDMAVKTGTTVLMDTDYVECWKGDALYEAAVSWAKTNYTSGGKLINGPEGLF